MPRLSTHMVWTQTFDSPAAAQKALDACVKEVESTDLQVYETTSVTRLRGETTITITYGKNFS